MAILDTVEVVFSVVSGQFISAMNSMNNAIKGQVHLFQNLQNVVADADDSIAKIGLATAGFANGLKTALIGPLQAAMEFEDNFARLKRLVDDTSQVDNFKNSIRGVISTVPLASKELFKFGEEALKAGANTVSAFEDLTRLGAELQANVGGPVGNLLTQMIRFTRSMGEPIAMVRETVNMTTKLANAFSTSEQEILKVSQRIGPMGRAFGLTKNEILALANAMREVNITSEAGGTVINQFLAKVQEGIAGNYEILDALSKIMNKSMQEIADAFRNDPTKAIGDFLVALDKAVKGGQPLSNILKTLGMENARQLVVLGQLKDAYDVYTDSLNKSREAITKAQSAQGQANQMWDTTANELKKLKNNVELLAVEIGKGLNREVRLVSDLLNTLTSDLKDSPLVQSGPAQAIIVFAQNTLGIAGALTLVTTGLTALGTSWTTLGRLMLTFSPWAAVIAGVILVITHFNELKELFNLLPDSVKNAFSKLVTDLKAHFDTIKMIVTTVGGELVTFFGTTLPNAFTTAKDRFTPLVTGIKDGISELITSFGTFILKVEEAFVKFVDKMVGVKRTAEQLKIGYDPQLPRNTEPFSRKLTPEEMRRPAPDPINGPAWQGPIKPNNVTPTTTPVQVEIVRPYPDEGSIRRPTYKPDKSAPLVANPKIAEIEKEYTDALDALTIKYKNVAKEVAAPQYIKDAISRTNAKFNLNLDENLIRAIIKEESNFNPKAVSPAGAQGLMQLMPATAERFNVKDPFNIEQNIEGGMKYVKFLLDKFKDVPLAVAGYNAGEGAVQRYRNTIPPYPETQNYVKKVMSTYGGGNGTGGSTQTDFLQDKLAALQKAFNDLAKIQPRDDNVRKSMERIGAEIDNVKGKLKETKVELKFDKADEKLQENISTISKVAEITGHKLEGMRQQIELLRSTAKRSIEIEFEKQAKLPNYKPDFSLAENLYKQADQVQADLDIAEARQKVVDVTEKYVVVLADLDDKVKEGIITPLEKEKSAREASLKVLKDYALLQEKVGKGVDLSPVIKQAQDEAAKAKDNIDTLTITSRNEQALQKAQNEVRQEAETILQSLRGSTWKYQDQIDGLNYALRNSMITQKEYQQAYTDLTMKFIESQPLYKELESVFGSLSDAITTAFDDILANGKLTSEGLKGIAKSILSTLGKIIAQVITTKIVMSLLGGASPSITGTTGAPTTYSAGGMTSYANMPVMGGRSGGGLIDQTGMYMMHADEAVVPLQSGAIPVQLSGGMFDNEAMYNNQRATDAQLALHEFASKRIVSNDAITTMINGMSSSAMGARGYANAANANYMQPASLPMLFENLQNANALNTQAIVNALYSIGGGSINTSSSSAFALSNYGYTTNPHVNTSNMTQTYGNYNVRGMDDAVSTKNTARARGQRDTTTATGEIGVTIINVANMEQAQNIAQDKNAIINVISRNIEERGPVYRSIKQTVKGGR